MPSDSDSAPPPQHSSSRPLVGLVPAAGHASRIGDIPCSKEVFPVGLAQSHSEGPRVACEFVLDRMRSAGVDRAYVILRDGKWDIPAYLRDGHRLDLPLGYLMMREPHGVPYTLNQAYPFVRDATVLLGFPDIMFDGDDPVFPYLLNQLDVTGAELVLGLFPTDRPEKGDMVDVDSTGRIRDIVVKSSSTSLRTGWILAAWTPTFTQFLHDYLAEPDAHDPDSQGELHLGEVFREAVDRGRDLRGVPVSGGRYIDIGTPEQLATFISGGWG